MTQPLMERVVNLIASGLRSRSTRRSFLSSVAVVGSAIATHPIVYASRPVSAYVAACGEGASCELGWSAFCCTVSGANQCPPGTFAAGWWKADQSSFCCGTARYYVDCNASCGSGWKCHCQSTSTCDHRLVACNQFRYGQCNTQITCYGPVVCRVITCTPPWKLVDGCTSTSRTDNRTATHTAPCLPGNCPSLITRYYYDHGGPGGPYGAIGTSERPGAPGSRYAGFANAEMFTVGTTVHVLTGPIDSRYRASRRTLGPLGYPVSGPTTSGATTKVVFQHGAIYYSAATGAHSIYGDFYTKWNAIHGVESGLGLPISERFAASGTVWELTFQHGVMCSSPSTGTHVVKAPLSTKYAAMNGPKGVLGAPIAEAASVTGLGQWQRFQRGNLFHLASGSVTSLTGAFLTKWKQLGGVTSALAFPRRDPSTVPGGSQQIFTHSALFTSPATGMHMVDGALYVAYDRWGGPAGVLGFPTSDPHAWGGKTRVDFQHGSLVLDPPTGTVTRLP